MTTANHPQNQQPQGGATDLGQITKEHRNTREQVEQIIDALEMGGANLTKTIKALNGIERGSYRVSIYNDNNWNEIQVRLKNGPGSRGAIASGYIDKGHTAQSRNKAAQDVRSLVRAYLCP